MNGLWITCNHSIEQKVKCLLIQVDSIEIWFLQWIYFMLKLLEDILGYIYSYIIYINWRKTIISRVRGLWIITLPFQVVIADIWFCYICNCIKVTIPVVNHSIAPDSHRCPVPLCSNWIKIPSWLKAFKSSVYSRQKNELKNKQMNIVVSIKNASFFHRLKGIIEHVGHSTENISPEPFNSLILCWSSSNP